jgi:hypothetical protein
MSTKKVVEKSLSKNKCVLRNTSSQINVYNDENAENVKGSKGHRCGRCKQYGHYITTCQASVS